MVGSAPGVEVRALERASRAARARAPDASRSTPYRPRPWFLTRAEAKFFRALGVALAPRYLVFPKVRLIDLCAAFEWSEHRIAANRIVQKHVDFLLCDERLRLVAAIELDDSWHARPDRQRADEVKNAFFSSIRLPLIRLPAQWKFDPVLVRQRIDAAIRTGVATTR